MDSNFDCSYSSWEELEIPTGMSVSSLIDEILRHYKLPLSNGNCAHISSSSSSSRQPAASFRLAGLADWQADFLSLFYVQVLAKHGSNVIIRHLESLCPVLCNLCANLRSSVCKNALLAVAYLARGIPFPYFTPYVPSLLPILINRALSDKRFISDSAWLACTTIVGPYCCSENTVYSVMHESHQHNNNAQYVAKCAELLRLSIKSILAPPPLVPRQNSPPPASSPSASYPSPSVASSLLLLSSDTTDTTPETASPSSAGSGPPSYQHSTITFSETSYAAGLTPNPSALPDYDASGRAVRLQQHRQTAAVAPHRASGSRCATQSQQVADIGSPHRGTAAAVRKPQYTTSRSISSPHLPNSSRGALGVSDGGGGSPGGRGSVFLRGIGTILANYLTGRLPATKTAARQTISVLVSYYGGDYTKQCLLNNGNVVVHCGATQGGAMGTVGLSPVSQGPSREALLRAITDAIAAVSKEDQRRPSVSSNRAPPAKHPSTSSSSSNYGTHPGSSSRGSSVSALRTAAPHHHLPQGAAAPPAQHQAVHRSPMMPTVGGATKPLVGGALQTASPPAFRRPLQLPHTMVPEGSRYRYPHHYGQ
eukprot:GHVS01033049.1.p1 GENE.GHVS01033049.1~~GHVS01033049.1.p1  ORF type:complete len:594 (-),score=95.80 GHVS01033049.1:112-1893(-)